jgi:hypothetical protein
MRPFRNKGWPWLNKFESILPIGGARGRNSFTATMAAAPPLQEEEEGPGDGEGSMYVGIGDRHGSEIIESSFSTIVPPVAAAPVAAGGEGDQMDVDIVADSAVGLSSIGKRKYSENVDHDTTATSEPVPPNSMAPPKKRVSSRGASSQVVSKTSSASGGAAGASSKAAAKITPAVAILNMQGSINRLTDIMERTLVAPPDSASKQRSEAMDLLQKQNDGLTVEEQSEMISKFVTDAAIAGAYLSLKENAELRRNWLKSILKSKQD